MELALIFLVVTGIIIWLIIWLLKLSSKQGSTLGVDWKDFKQACEQNQVSDIVLIGLRLCDNFHLTKEQFEQISEYTEKNISRFPELEKLRIAVMNKHAKWHRRSPPW